MSSSLEKIMRLNDMQRRHAQGDALMQLSGAMGNPNIQGRGLDRMLATLVAGAQPAMQAYGQSEAASQAKNLEAYKLQQKEAEMARRAAMEAKREERLNKQMAQNEAYNNRYLDIMAAKSGNKNKKNGEETAITETSEQNAVGIPYSQMGKNEQLFATKDMSKNLKVAESTEEADNTVKEMKKILKEHPKLSEYLGPAIANPEQAGTFLETLKRNAFLDKKQLAASQKFRKLSNDLILHGGQALGAQNFTDAKLKVITESKPLGEYTYEANMYLLDNLEKRFSHGKGWAKALRNGIKNRVYVVSDPELYREKEQIQGEIPSTTTVGNRQFKVIDNETGKEMVISESELKVLQEKGEVE